MAAEPTDQPTDQPTEQPTDADYERLLEFRTGLRRFLHWSEEEAASIGLTASQHQLLLAVRGNPEPSGPTIGAVAEALVLRHHSAVGLVDRAVRGGLLERCPDPDDHRIVRLRLTAAGERLIRRLSRAHLEELRVLVPRLRALWEGVSAGAKNGERT